MLSDICQAGNLAGFHRLAHMAKISSFLNYFHSVIGVTSVPIYRVLDIKPDNNGFFLITEKKPSQKNSVNVYRRKKLHKLGHQHENLLKNTFLWNNDQKGGIMTTKRYHF